MELSRRVCFGGASAAGATATIATLASPAAALVANVSMLEAVIKRGTLIAGVSLGTRPYGTINARKEPDGFDVAVAKLLAGELGVTLCIVDTAAANRIPSLLTGEIDIVVSSLSITSERARHVAFSNAIYVDQQVVAAPNSVPMAGFADMRGRRVGVTGSTTNDTVLTQHAQEGIDVRRYDADADTMAALLDGRVHAVVCSRAVAADFKDRNAKLDLETKFVVSKASMAVGLRRGDPDWLHWINTCLFMLWTNRDIQALQTEWMGAANGEQARFG